MTSGVEGEVWKAFGELLKIGLAVGSSIFAAIKWVAHREQKQREREEEKDRKQLEYEREERERDEEHETIRREREEQRDRLFETKLYALEQTLRKNIHDVANQNALNENAIGVLREQSTWIKESIGSLSRKQDEVIAVLMKLMHQRGIN